MRMQRRSTPRGRKTAQQTRVEILQEAERMFVERGYELTTIAGIAAALRISPATIFKHFSSNARMSVNHSLSKSRSCA
ncbi:helix-turn-helix domain-containing protein [Rhizobium sp. S152]|uniref:helix-turn-helix domain-containing protein n=1 Tax=Rhizobium sp. S152 TaxID=3055038 RepID=UPI003FA7C762